MTQTTDYVAANNTSIYDDDSVSPVIERIADTIMARIVQANIYKATVSRPDREGKNFTPSDRSVVIHQRSVVFNQASTHEGNPPAFAYDATFHLQCYVRNQNDVDNAYSAACNVLAAQVVKAITNPPVDPLLWYNLDGNAINSQIGTMFPMVNDTGNNTGVVLPLTVLFRISENNPFEVRP
jgi:hypothetical protein